jgi:threonine synthase
MDFFNINDTSERVSLREAVLKSTMNVPGLYMPEGIPVMPEEFFTNLHKLNLQEIAYKVSVAMLGDDIPDYAIQHIVKEAITFDIPLKKLDKDLYVLELFHGPTMAFKDVGARFMAALFEYFIKNENREVTILVATSGDTGSAVASAFYNREGIKVVILYPSGKVSKYQEKQLTTMGGNITALEVEGNFDDCQRLVKEAFADKELNDRLNLTSANSINFARLFPQSFYYFHAMSQLNMMEKPIVISVPSGNFGNLTAGLIAKKMGLPVDTFIAANNSNHPVADYLETGKYEPQQTKHTISNAMDVGNPSNFPRILSLYNQEHKVISSDIKSNWYSDEQTGNAMKDLQKKYNYQADPHGAIAYIALKEYKAFNNCTGIFLETAHPAKFPDEVEKSTGIKVSVPDGLKKLMVLEKKAIKIPGKYESLKKLLI